MLELIGFYIRSEISYFHKLFAFNNTSAGISWIGGRLVVMTILLCYTINQDHQLTASSVFSTVALLEAIMIPTMGHLSQTFFKLTMLLASVKRLQVGTKSSKSFSQV